MNDQPYTPCPRRTFFKQTGAVLLSFQVLDLIPSAYAQKSNNCGLNQPDDTCNTDKAGAPGGKDTDDHCVVGQQPDYDNDDACRAASETGPDSDPDGVCGAQTGGQIQGNEIHDQDQACNSHGANGTFETDQDGSCGFITGQSGVKDTDEACNDANFTDSDPDNNCRKIGGYDKDESCVWRNFDPDEACGYFNKGQRDVDQNCGVSLGEDLGFDSDNTYPS